MVLVRPRPERPRARASSSVLCRRWASAWAASSRSSATRWRGGGLSARGDRQLRRRVGGANETALGVESQLEDFDLHDLWPRIEPDELTLALFDLELATKHLAAAAHWVAAGATMSDGACDTVVHALGARGLGTNVRSHGLSDAGELAEKVRVDAAAAIRSAAWRWPSATSSRRSR